LDLGCLSLWTWFSLSLSLSLSLFVPCFPSSLLGALFNGVLLGFHHQIPVLVLVLKSDRFWSGWVLTNLDQTRWVDY